jgi:hypothetical protein
MSEPVLSKNAQKRARRSEDKRIQREHPVSVRVAICLRVGADHTMATKNEVYDVNVEGDGSVSFRAEGRAFRIRIEPQD